MADPLVRLETEGFVATVTLNRPEKLNALTSGMLAELETIAAGLERRDDIRVVLLTGAGAKAFCAGADIADWGSYAPLDFGRHWVREGHRVFDRWARLRQPLLAVLNGIAFGGGLELAACADLRVAEAHVRVALPESRIGIIPGWSGTQRLVRRAGPSAVKRLALTGEPVDAEEALRLGLVDYLRPTGDGMVFARTLATTIAERAPIAVQTAKQLVNVAEGEEAAAALEAIAGALAATTEDAAEGVAAFRDKRPATFTNR
ncbi:MAG TPA: enoyl-CoA hydratase/isomerase family protein [Geminicoccaceae bacterium]|nr:enoyl-CoA hydratase/isomerase family protein [Geminicoccus sp.]HMU52237.1 enoyl-CoA hydratase/isomerase family protein [Geminicoccaceae bacterium]